MHPSARHISLMSYCGYSPHQQKSIIKHSGPHQSHKASTQMKHVPCSPKVTPRMTGQGITLLPEQKASPKPSPELHFKPRMPRAGQKSCHRALRQGQQQLCNCLQCSCITPVLCFYELLTARHKKQQPRGRVVSPLPFTHPKEKKVGGGGNKRFCVVSAAAQPSGGGSSRCAGCTAEPCSQPLLAGQHYKPGSQASLRAGNELMRAAPLLFSR